MKTKLNVKKLPLCIACMGALALLGRIALFALGEDEKGLLVPGHPLDVLVWVLTAVAVVLTAGSILKLAGSEEYGDNFTPSAAAAMGCWVLAGGIALTVVSGWDSWSRLDMIRNVFGLISVPALVLLGLHRKQGRPPFFLLHGIVCLYLILYAVSHYQLWSSRPQLQHWFFSMAGAIALTLFAYCQTAFDVSMGSRRMQLGTGLLAAFFCLAAMAGGDDPLLYLTGAVWTLTNLCALPPVPGKRKGPGTDRIQEETK